MVKKYKKSDEQKLKEDVSEGYSMSLEVAMSKLTDLQKAYSEFRAKGFSQSKSAAMAGSKCTGDNLAKAGHAMEKLEHVQLYTEYVARKRLMANCLDKDDLTRMMVDLYEMSKAKGNTQGMGMALQMMGASQAIFKSVSESTVRSENTTVLKKGDSVEDLDSQIYELLGIKNVSSNKELEISSKSSRTKDTTTSH